MEKKIVIGIKNCGDQLLHHDTVSSDNLKELQEKVKGNIEVVYPFEDKNLIMIVNKEGKLKNMPYNFRCNNDYIAGTAVFARVNLEGDLESIKLDDIDTITDLYLDDLLEVIRSIL